jgi:hypothetical protein
LVIILFNNSNKNAFKLNLKEKRKWRSKNSCKSCGERDEDRMVIKCLNTKCKCTIHIDCAIDLGMIISLDYMCDFYGLDKEYVSECIPFYCSKHNRDLVKEYSDYLEQLKECLKMSTTSNKMLNDYDNVNTDANIESDSFSNWNISNLSHPEFNYNNVISSTQDNDYPDTNISVDNNICNSALKDEFYKVEKPKYIEADDDELDHLVNVEYSATEPLYKTLNDFNFAFVSKQFYDYYDRDIKQIEEGGRSSITISEIKDLKEFFLKAVSAYKDYDVELSDIYVKLFNS